MKSSYKRAGTLRIIALALLLFTLLFVAVKVYTSYDKMRLYNKAKDYLAQNDLVHAEEYYTKASGITMIEYKNTETAKALDALGPVTHMKKEMNALDEQLDKNGDGKNIPALVQAHSTYLKYKTMYTADAKNAEIFNSFSAQLKMEARLKEVFAKVKTLSLDALQANIKKNAFTENGPILNLLQIPDEYFGGAEQKASETNSQLQKYDQARFDFLAKQGTPADLIKEGQLVLNAYKEAGYDAGWVMGMADQAAAGLLSKQYGQKDLSPFLQNARAVERIQGFGGGENKTTAFIRKAVSDQFKKAEQLVQNNKYKEAIDLYTTLGAYRDTAKETAGADLAWSENDPSRLLKQQMPDTSFTHVVSGKDRFGAKIYAAGIAGNNLVFVKMLPDRTLSVAKGPFTAQLKIAGMKFDDTLSVNGLPVIVAQAAASSDRKAHYFAYEVSGENLRKILDVEADDYINESQGVLVVDNPVSLEKGQKAFYRWTSNNEYTFYAVKPDFVDIDISQLPNYKNTKVRFAVNIIALDSGQAVAALNNSYILMTGNVRFSLGRFKVTGTWTSIDNIQNGDQTFQAYRFGVTKLE